MIAIFHDMIEKTMEVFMDDFSVFGDSFSSCLSNLDKMLKRCEDTNLVLNWEKCHFMCKEGIILGHKILKSGIEVDRAKVDVIAKLPHPTTVKAAGHHPPPKNFSGGIFQTNPKILIILRSIRSSISLSLTRRRHPAAIHHYPPPSPQQPHALLPPPLKSPPPSTSPPYCHLQHHRLMAATAANNRSHHHGSTPQPTATTTETTFIPFVFFFFSIR
uniref:Reverse transcriptase domain-containing protein n=1 Tax=Tanacetum cinerariifolium TaxID=118510 RepID=A0A699HUS7_TANCI|nr:reverse transcriptase domain-containing protein [Tanacetum cinerariifolium]